MATAIMIQGTGSNVGKSVIVAGLVRAFARRGYDVAPFKPQNISNNAAVTADGGEIGRAQALQALAAGRDPLSDMNPILMKPDAGSGVQVIVQGQRVANFAGAAERPRLMRAVMESFTRLSRSADMVIVEGAGSPAEVNLRAHDIANMGFARAADVPVVLMGDIDRGGVIAQIVGSHAVLSPGDVAQIRGFAVNKFRGDPALFQDGMGYIATRTGWPSVGLIPWFADAWRLPAEDAMDLQRHTEGLSSGSIRIAVPLLAHIANFDDLDPLMAEPDVDLVMVPRGQALPGDADLVLIPGSKSTIADLQDFRAQGWDIDLHAHIRRGGQVLGLCGGYQMLGQSIADPHGIEGPPQRVAGLGYLDVETVLGTEKTLQYRRGTCRLTGARVEGYDIHLGQTEGPDRAHGWLSIDETTEGAASSDARIRGTYMHGIFASDGFRAAFLRGLGGQGSGVDYGQSLDHTLNALAQHVAQHMDLDAMLAVMKKPG